MDTTEPRLGPKFFEALHYAAELHNNQVRKGGEIPYIGHLLSVAGLVLEADGNETQAIAALLHDSAEDQGGEAVLAEIETRFGPDVAAINPSESDRRPGLDAEAEGRPVRPSDQKPAGKGQLARWDGRRERGEDLEGHGSGVFRHRVSFFPVRF